MKFKNLLILIAICLIMALIDLFIYSKTGYQRLLYPGLFGGVLGYNLLTERRE